MPHPAIAFRHEITRAGRTYKVEGPEVAQFRVARPQPEPAEEDATPEESPRIPEVKRAAEGPKTPPNYRSAPGSISHCSSCKNFESLTDHCKKFHSRVDTNYVCDEWESKSMSFPGATSPSNTPGTSSLGDVGDIGKMAAANALSDMRKAAWVPHEGQLGISKLPTHAVGNAASGIAAPTPQPLTPPITLPATPQGPPNVVPPVMDPKHPVPNMTGQPKLASLSGEGMSGGSGGTAGGGLGATAPAAITPPPAAAAPAPSTPTPSPSASPAATQAVGGAGAHATGTAASSSPAVTGGGWKPSAVLSNPSQIVQSPTLNWLRAVKGPFMEQTKVSCLVPKVLRGFLPQGLEKSATQSIVDRCTDSANIVMGQAKTAGEALRSVMTQVFEKQAIVPMDETSTPQATQSTPDRYTGVPASAESIRKRQAIDPNRFATKRAPQRTYNEPNLSAPAQEQGVTYNQLLGQNPYSGTSGNGARNYGGGALPQLLGQQAQPARQPFSYQAMAARAEDPNDQTAMGEMKRYMDRQKELRALREGDSGQQGGTSSGGKAFDMSKGFQKQRDDLGRQYLAAQGNPALMQQYWKQKAQVDANEARWSTPVNAGGVGGQDSSGLREPREMGTQQSAYDEDKSSYQAAMDSLDQIKRQQSAAQAAGESAAQKRQAAIAQRGFWGRSQHGPFANWLMGDTDQPSDEENLATSWQSGSRANQIAELQKRVEAAKVKMEASRGALQQMQKGYDTRNDAYLSRQNDPYGLNTPAAPASATASDPAAVARATLGPKEPSDPWANSAPPPSSQSEPSQLSGGFQKNLVTPAAPVQSGYSPGFFGHPQNSTTPAPSAWSGSAGGQPIAPTPSTPPPDDKAMAPARAILAQAPPLPGPLSTKPAPATAPLTAGPIPAGATPADNTAKGLAPFFNTPQPAAAKPPIPGGASGLATKYGPQKTAAAMSLCFVKPKRKPPSVTGQTPAAPINAPAGDHASSSKGMPSLPAVSGSKMAFVEELAKSAANFVPTLMAMQEREKAKKMMKAQKPQRKPAPDEDLGRLDSLVDDLKTPAVKAAALAALR